MYLSVLTVNTSQWVVRAPSIHVTTPCHT